MGDDADLFSVPKNPQFTCAIFVVKMRPLRQSLGNNPHLENETFQDYYMLVIFFY